MREIIFEFDIDDRVKTIFDETGIVDMACVNNSGNNVYLIKLKDKENTWFKETQLLKA